jgi:hypothetical protein
MHESKPLLYIIWCSTGQKKKTKKPERVTQYNGHLYVMHFNRTVAKGSSKTRLKREEGMIIIIKRSIRVQNSYWNFEAPLHKSE